MKKQTPTIKAFTKTIINKVKNPITSQMAGRRKRAEQPYLNKSNSQNQKRKGRAKLPYSRKAL
jgi:hypothetical protein